MTCRYCKRASLCKFLTELDVQETEVVKAPNLDVRKTEVVKVPRQYGWC
jgi:hypothetical protein